MVRRQALKRRGGKEGKLLTRASTIIKTKGERSVKCENDPIFINIRAKGQFGVSSFC